MFIRTALFTTLAALLLLAACAAPAMPNAESMTDSAPAQSDSAMPATEAMTETTAAGEMADEAMAADTMSADAMADSAMMTATHTMTDSTSATMETDDAMTEAVMDLPAWQTLPLTDARTGETFTLADFAGKTVFVETMATWCPNCRQQLGNVRNAAAQADSDQVIFLAISVETDLAPQTLADYADNNDFGWTFAVATPELVQALGATFGPTIANPPATPHFLIFPDGTHSDLVTGFETGDEILAQLAQP